jgi:aspartate racemase
MKPPKHIGIVAVSAEGAALCYRTICAEGPAIFGPHMHPEITMHTIPLGEYMRVADGGWNNVGELLLNSARKLADAGAELLICPDNTAHESIDLIIDHVRLPWIHIAEEVARSAAEQRFGRVGLLGTRRLMEGPVYPPKFAARGIGLITPDAADRIHISRIIFDELVYGRFEDSARRYFVAAIEKLKARGCDAVALSCTEIPLLISAADSPLPILDSTRILARAALREAISAPADVQTVTK